jgi:hypothetical protein
MLTVDSFSRRHFYRKLPKTINFMNEINSANSSYENHTVFDFKLHNLLSGDSVENMVPVFGDEF